MNRSKKFLKKKSLRRKNFKRNSKKISKRKKNNKQKGGYKWGSWEGASTMNNRFAPFIYNRFQRVPFLSEMGNLSPYE